MISKILLSVLLLVSLVFAVEVNEDHDNLSKKIEDLRREIRKKNSEWEEQWTLLNDKMRKNVREWDILYTQWIDHRTFVNERIFELEKDYEADRWRCNKEL